MSWEDIDKPFEEKPQPQKTIELISLTNAIFNLNEEGKRWLKLMEDLYFPMPVCPLDKPVTYGYFREGQNQILRDINEYINMYKESIKPKEKLNE